MCDRVLLQVIDMNKLQVQDYSDQAVNGSIIATLVFKPTSNQISGKLCWPTVPQIILMYYYWNCSPLHKEKTTMLSWFPRENIYDNNKLNYCNLLGSFMGAHNLSRLIYWCIGYNDISIWRGQDLDHFKINYSAGKRPWGDGYLYK